MDKTLTTHDLLNKVPVTFKNWDSRQVARYKKTLKNCLSKARQRKKNSKKLQSAADNVRRYFY